MVFREFERAGAIPPELGSRTNAYEMVQSTLIFIFFAGPSDCRGPDLAKLGRVLNA